MGVKEILWGRLMFYCLFFVVGGGGGFWLWWGVGFLFLVFLCVWGVCGWGWNRRRSKKKGVSGGKAEIHISNIKEGNWFGFSSLELQKPMGRLEATSSPKSILIQQSKSGTLSQFREIRNGRGVTS